MAKHYLMEWYVKLIFVTHDAYGVLELSSSFHTVRTYTFL